jgi:hypothetical protein
MPTLQVEQPMVMVSNPDPGVGEECQKTDLDTIVGESAKILDLLAAKSLLEVVAVTRKVHWLWKILPMASWVPGYSENPVTQ